MITILHHPLILLLAFVLGAALGSFGNVYVIRTQKGGNVGGRSKCPYCKKVLQSYELIPVISYVLQLGRCRGCKHPLSPQYIIMEILCGLLMVAAFVMSKTAISALLLGVAFWLMVCIASYDFKTQTIPDALNYSLLAVTIAYAWSIALYSWWSPIILIGFFGLQWLLSKGTWIGSGDVLLAAALSPLFFSWPQVVLMIGLSYITGAIYASYLLAKESSSKQHMIAFGPFLIIGAIIVTLANQQLLALF
jgi:prepilin signal peptidase PulO-like enzyme (type II secretory pathway)